MLLPARSPPSIAIPFPKPITGPSSPSEHDYSDANFSSPGGNELPTSMTPEKQPHSFSQKQIPHTWGTTSTFHTMSSSMSTARVFSLSSATSISTLPPIGSSSWGHDVPVCSPPHNLRMGPRSALQFLAQSLSRKKSARASGSSQFIPTNPSASVEFATRTTSPGYNPVVQLQQFSTSLPEGLDIDSGSDHKPSDSIASTVDRKQHDRSALHTRKLTKTPNLRRSQTQLKRAFDAGAPLTVSELESARNLEVLDQDGVRMKFEDLWKGQKTCVIFIRHFRCHLCMDYIRSIVEYADPEVLRQVGVGLVVISNGSPGMIKSYLKLFKFPYQMYTDPSLTLYRALGMTLRKLDPGPDSEKGEYVKHGTAAGIAIAIKYAVQGHMPIHKPGGDIKQLGGEFILGPGLRCSYTSRMRNTRSHTLIQNVLAAAGVDLTSHPDPLVAVQPRTMGDEEEWMRYRETELQRIRAKKGMRRGFPTDKRNSDGYESDNEEIDRSVEDGGDMLFVTI